MYYLHQNFDYRPIENELHARLGFALPDWVRPPRPGNINLLPGRALKVFYLEDQVLKDSAYWGKWQRPFASNPFSWAFNDSELGSIEGIEKRSVLIPVSSISAWPEAEQTTARAKFHRNQVMKKPADSFRTIAPAESSWGMIKGVIGKTLKQEKSGIKEVPCFKVVERDGLPNWISVDQWAIWLNGSN